jgi:hypothetical protein
LHVNNGIDIFILITKFANTFFLSHSFDNNEKKPPNLIANCENKDRNDVNDELNFCEYDYDRVLKDYNYTFENRYGYDDGPLLLLKLNKIYNWKPQAYTETQADDLARRLNVENNTVFYDLIENNIVVKCDGEHPADMDAFKSLFVQYISINKNPFDKEFGLIPFYYYPFLNQNGYHQPLVFLKLKYTPNSKVTNTLVNIVCRAYASNIDSDDKQARRGMTLFNIFVKS